MTGAIVDTNVYLGRWPWRRMPLDDAAALATKLKQDGVTQAWAGSFEGIFQRDLRGANERLFDECRQHGGLFLPVGSINPALPDWEEDLRRCQEDWHMNVVRLHPNYHGYKLDDAAGRALSAAAERG